MSKLKLKILICLHISSKTLSYKLHKMAKFYIKYYIKFKIQDPTYITHIHRPIYNYLI